MSHIWTCWWNRFRGTTCSTTGILSCTLLLFMGSWYYQCYVVTVYSIRTLPPCMQKCKWLINYGWFYWQFTVILAHAHAVDTRPSFLMAWVWGYLFSYVNCKNEIVIINNFRIISVSNLVCMQGVAWYNYRVYVRCSCILQQEVYMHFDIL